MQTNQIEALLDSEFTAEDALVYRIGYRLEMQKEINLRIIDEARTAAVTGAPNTYPVGSEAHSLFFEVWTQAIELNKAKRERRQIEAQDAAQRRTEKQKRNKQNREKRGEEARKLTAARTSGKK